MSKNVTLEDIAAKVGVSIVTVSKALSGQKGVGENTRDLICKAAKEMGYLRNKDVDGAGLDYTIGVVTAARYLTDRMSMYWTVYRDLSMLLSGKGCFCLLEIVSEEAEQAGDLPGLLTEKNLDGLFILGSMERGYTQQLEAAAEVAVSFIDTVSPSDGYDCVVSNNFRGGYQMVEYLLNLGHRRIGFVGTLLTTDSIDDRYLGGMKALMERGLSYEPGWVVNDRDPVTGELYENGLTLPQREMPTAFFCSSDRTGQLLLQELGRMNLRVPEDVSLVGFDNYEEIGRGEPFLTTYDINRKEMVSQAARQMLRRIGGKERYPGVTLVQGRCVLRGSARQIGEPVPYGRKKLAQSASGLPHRGFPKEN